jgi:hypothetical protein
MQRDARPRAVLQVANRDCEEGAGAVSRLVGRPLEAGTSWTVMMKSRMIAREYAQTA